MVQKPLQTGSRGYVAWTRLAWNTGAVVVLSTRVWTFASCKVLHVKMHTGSLFYGAKFCEWTHPWGVAWEDGEFGAVLGLYPQFLSPLCPGVDPMVSSVVPSQRFMDCWIIKPLKNLFGAIKQSSKRQFLKDCLAAAKRTEDTAGAE